VGDSTTTTLNLQVGQSSDDCHRELGSDAWDLTVVNANAGDLSSSNYDYSMGMRFTGATIGQGDTIDAASIQLRAAIIAGTIPTTYIEGEDADDAATFTTSANYDGRARTSAVSWTPGAWVDNTWYTSSELKTLLQAIVNRGGWAGDGVVFFWRYDVLGWGGVQKVIGADNYDATDTTWAAKLDLDYTAGGAGVTVLAALATASALSPVAIALTGLAVVAVLSTATALSYAAGHINTVVAQVSTATALSPASSVSGQAIIGAVLATATGLSYAATVIIGGGITVAAVLATATALSFEATLSLGATISAILSTATAKSYDATVLTGMLVLAVISTATAKSWDSAFVGGATVAASLSTATAKSWDAAVLLGNTVIAALPAATARSWEAVINPGATIAAALSTASALALTAIAFVTGRLLLRAGDASGKRPDTVHGSARVAPPPIGHASIDTPQDEGSGRQ